MTRRVLSMATSGNALLAAFDFCSGSTQEECRLGTVTKLRQILLRS
jgi:hypothetical protein